MSRTFARELTAVSAMLWLLPLHAQQPLPSDVTNFIEQRTLCDHFRAEPWPEGKTAEEQERREFLLSQSERYCTGTDETLRLLRERYRGDTAVLQRLENFEYPVEIK